LALGLLLFLKKKIPVIRLSTLLFVFMSLFLYFTYIDFNTSVRIVVYGLTIVLLHIYIYLILYRYNKENNKSTDLLSLIIIIFFIIYGFRIIQLLSTSITDTFHETTFNAMFIMLLAAIGLMTSAGIYALIDNKLLDEMKEGKSTFNNFIERFPI